METPGLSIFQGGGSIHPDSSSEDLEDEADRRRLQEELQDQLLNAFDDLDNGECSIDTSVDPQSQYRQNDIPMVGGHIAGGGHLEQQLQHLQLNGNAGLEREMDPRIPYQNNDLSSVVEEEENVIRHPQQANQHHFLYGAEIGRRNSGAGKEEIREYQTKLEELQKIVDSKTREIETLSKYVHDERKRNDDLKKRLTLSEAEKERAEVAATREHELLVDSKSKISEMEAQMSQLETKTKNLEDKNVELEGELERTKLQLSDALQKYRSIERNASHTADLSAENMIRDANGRHVAQMTVLQQQIHSFQDKLDVKEQEYNTLDARYKELQRNRETLLIEKSNAINQLARSLEESQKHCQELMAKQVDLQENKRLQGLVSQYERQSKDMQKTINELTARLESTSSELTLMEEYIDNNTSFANLFHKSIGKESTSRDSPRTVDNRIVRLKDELYRSIAAQKGKREEIRKLQEQLSQQNEEIRTLKDSENKALIEISTTKEENTRLGSRLRLIEAELNELREAKQKVDEIMKNLHVDLDRMKEENASMCNKLSKAESDLEESRKTNTELQTEIDNLLEKIKAKRESDDLINELQQKALRLEEYIRNVNNSKPTPKTPPQLIDRAVSTTPERDSDESYDNYRRKVESTIRDEMARVFAVKLETIKNAFQAKCKELESENSQLQTNFRQIYDDLQTREHEVELLKECILKEREQVREQMEQINLFVDNVRKELERRQQKIVQLQHDLDETSVRIETERKSMKAVMEQWETRQQKYERTVEELESQVEKVKQEYQHMMDDMQRKYNTAKKTAANYKRYAEDKDKHIKDEYNRLKAGFDAKVENLKKKFESRIKEIQNTNSTEDKT